jgi:hypothetical protein
MKTENAIKKNTLDARVRKVAETNSGKGVGMEKWFNLPQYKKMRVLHIDICKKLVELSNKNEGYPITYLVYFAVGKNAHRIEVFQHGYERIDEKKAETILNWLHIFAKHNNNPKLFRNPNLAHVLCRYYDKYSEKTKDFRALLKNYAPNPKVKDFKTLASALGIAKETKSEAEEKLEAVAVSAE